MQLCEYGFIGTLINYKLFASNITLNGKKTLNTDQFEIVHTKYNNNHVHKFQYNILVLVGSLILYTDIFSLKQFENTYWPVFSNDGSLLYDYCIIKGFRAYIVCTHVLKSDGLHVFPVSYNHWILNWSFVRTKLCARDELTTCKRYRRTKYNNHKRFLNAIGFELKLLYSHDNLPRRFLTLFIVVKL